MQRKEIVRVKLLAELGLMVALREFVREVALGEGVNKRESELLMLATEEAAVNIIRHGLENDRNASYEMILERAPGQLILAFEDQGVPLNWDTICKSENDGLGILLIRHCADGFNFINLGKRGKRLEIIKNLIPQNLDNTEIEEERRPEGEQQDIAPLDTPIELRSMTTGDCSLLIRCMYQVYGYTYKDAVYYPEKIAELLNQQLLFAVVAVTSDGEIIGHQGLLKPRPDAMTAEITMGVVHPRYRGRGLFERLKEEAFIRLRTDGLPGLFGEAVCNHPYSQKANFAMGGRPCGFMLGFVPGDRVFAKIEEGTKQERVTVVLFHTRLNETPSKLIYPPVQHRGVIERTFAACGVLRELGSSALEEPEGISSNITLRTVPENGIAYLDVITIGEEFGALVRDMLRKLCLMRFDCIYIDLPLSDPLTAFACTAAEVLGFFYAGIIPEYLPSGDALRLQYLNNVPINPDKVVIVTDFGKELFAYIANEYQRSM